MKKTLALAGTAALLTATIVGVIAVSHAGAAVMNYTATLAATNEVPPNASGYTGMANITIDSATNQVCVTATTTIPNSDPIILDHIHSGAAGVNGPIVVDFMTNLNTCVTGDPTVVANIIANPGAFYFNVHTNLFQGGAVRGQLALVPPSTTVATTAAPTTTRASTTTVAPVVAARPAFTG